MRKNPYLAQAENVKFDKRGQDIIKKARRFGVVVYDNQSLGKALLETKVEPKNFTCNQMFEFFIWCLEAEKDVQMSGD